MSYGHNFNVIIKGRCYQTLPLYIILGHIPYPLLHAYYFQGQQYTDASDINVNVWRSGVRFRARTVIFLFRTSSGDHPASYRISTWSSFSGGKEAGTRSSPITSLWDRGLECTELYIHVR